MSSCQFGCSLGIRQRQTSSFSLVIMSFVELSIGLSASAVLWMPTSCTINMTVFLAEKLSTQHPSFLLSSLCFVLSIWLSTLHHSISPHPAVVLDRMSKDISEIWACWQDFGHQGEVPACVKRLMVGWIWYLGFTSHSYSHHNKGTKWLYWISMAVQCKLWNQKYYLRFVGHFNWALHNTKAF